MYLERDVKKSLLGGGLPADQPSVGEKAIPDLPEPQPCSGVFLTTSRDKDIDEIDLTLSLEIVPEIDCPDSRRKPAEIEINKVPCRPLRFNVLKVRCSRSCIEITHAFLQGCIRFHFSAWIEIYTIGEVMG